MEFIFGIVSRHSMATSWESWNMGNVHPRWVGPRVLTSLSPSNGHVPQDAPCVAAWRGWSWEFQGPCRAPPYARCAPADVEGKGHSVGEAMKMRMMISHYGQLLYLSCITIVMFCSINSVIKSVFVNIVILTICVIPVVMSDSIIKLYSQ